MLQRSFVLAFSATLGLLTVPAFAQTTSPKCPGEKGSMFVNNRDRNPKEGGFVGHGTDVSESAFVAPSAAVCGSAIVSNSARISGEAVVRGDAEVRGRARVFGNAIVEGSAVVEGEARISGNAIVAGDAVIGGKAKVRAFARIRSGNITEGIHAPEKSAGEAAAEANAAATRLFASFKTRIEKPSPHSSLMTQIDMTEWKLTDECSARVTSKHETKKGAKLCSTSSVSFPLQFADIRKIKTVKHNAFVFIHLKKLYRSTLFSKTSFIGPNCDKYLPDTSNISIGNKYLTVKFDHIKDKSRRELFIAALRARQQKCRK
jgi:carbonic anhydrase/acetyltransferase-like protein (isoleucine patch superfamily)